MHPERPLRFILPVILVLLSACSSNSSSPIDGGASPSSDDAGVNRDGSSSDGAASEGATGVGCDGGCLTDPDVPNPAATVSPGYAHTCAVTRAGAAMCWGKNEDGELGNGTQLDSLVPAPVTDLDSGVVDIKSGSAISCALLANGTVRCWGKNNREILGANAPGSTSATPVEIAGISDARMLTIGQAHACALLNSGSVVCWGSNDVGQLNAETNELPSSATPRAITLKSRSPVKKIVSGSLHTCALLESAEVECWGYNLDTRIGAGTCPPDEARIAHLCVVTGFPTDATVIDIGTHSAADHTCAILTGGRARCWGTNRFGQLGDGADISEDSAIPVAVATLTFPTWVTGGKRFGCATMQPGGAKCWGANLNGELGAGDHVDGRFPVDVVGLKGEVSLIAAAEDHTCAVTATGQVLCWGKNTYGQLGTGNRLATNVPLPVVLP